jgi:hypothetical protein
VGSGEAGSPWVRLQATGRRHPSQGGHGCARVPAGIFVRPEWRRACGRGGYGARSGKNSAISRAADSWESDPCTRFSVVSIARSPRMVPGRRLGRVGAAHHEAHHREGVLGPFDHHEERRRASDERHQITEERFLGVLAVVGRGHLLGDGPELGRHQAQLLALQARQDLTGQPTLEAVGLHDYQGAVHEEWTLHRSRRASRSLRAQRPASSHGTADASASARAAPTT